MWVELAGVAEVIAEAVVVVEAVEVVEMVPEVPAIAKEVKMVAVLMAVAADWAAGTWSLSRRQQGCREHGQLPGIPMPGWRAALETNNRFSFPCPERQYFALVHRLPWYTFGHFGPPASAPPLPESPAIAPALLEQHPNPAPKRVVRQVHLHTWHARAACRAVQRVLAESQ